MIHSEELLEVLKLRDLDAFIRYCQEKKLFIARSSHLISLREWRALYYQASLNYDEFEDEAKDMVAWMAKNGFFRLLL